jgi:4-hydroxy-tetrahydrodipicolinate synthase
LSDDWPKAREIHYRMLPLVRALILETNPIPVKAAMSMLGLCRDDLRLPLLPMSDGPRAALKEAMQQLGLL